MRDERKDRALIIKSLDAERGKCERGEKIKKTGWRHPEKKHSGG